MKLDLPALWYRTSLTSLTRLLLPFSWLFAICAATRRTLYKWRVLKSYHFPVPIIVVGNITAGGTGKTPFVIWLAKILQEQGYRPGIVSRGVGGRLALKPYHVQTHDSPEKVGDEALLLARNTHVPVFICKNRVAAVQQLLQTFRCDVVISDDGLQHYRLARDLEIAMIDHVRQFGNQRLLPAGPLREPISRLKQVDFQVITGGEGENAMQLIPIELMAVAEASNKPMGDVRVHAVAGIGHPERFFTQLEQAGFLLIKHPFPDHYRYKAKDLDFKDSLPILMTEKDAVKCSDFADDRYWYLKITAKISDGFKEKLLLKIKSLKTTLGEQQNDDENDFAGCSAHGACPLRNHYDGEKHFD